VSMSSPENGPPEVRWHPRGFNNALIFGATYKGVGRLPLSLSYMIGHGGTWLASHVMRRATAAVVDNLRHVFPERNHAELKRLALLTYRSYARDTIDFMRSLSMDAGTLREIVGPVQTNHFDRVLAEGRGAIAVSAHFGNWELGGLLLRRLFNYPLTLVVMAELSPAVNRLRRQFRSSWDIETIEVRQSLDTALRIRRLLGQNQIVAMLLDRHLGRDHVAVEFFGRQAHFLRTPALMGYLTGAPLVPSFVYAQEDGRFAGVCCEPIRVERNGDRDANVQRATQAFARVLEEQIRERPQYWYQFYPFWATQSMPEHDDRVKPDRL
jgi:Kdo2-lipid IVA lauroyltransferase/acyltransferase